MLRSLCRTRPRRGLRNCCSGCPAWSRVSRRVPAASRLSGRETVLWSLRSLEPAGKPDKSGETSRNIRKSPYISCSGTVHRICHSSITSCSRGHDGPGAGDGSEPATGDSSVFLCCDGAWCSQTRVDLPRCHRGAESDFRPTNRSPRWGQADRAFEPPVGARVLVGPERRTRETARLLGLDAAPLSRLRDLDAGAWRGAELGTSRRTASIAGGPPRLPGARRRTGAGPARTGPRPVRPARRR